MESSDCQIVIDLRGVADQINVLMAIKIGSMARARNSTERETITFEITE
jgi:hypothetical protein